MILVAIENGIYKPTNAMVITKSGISKHRENGYEPSIFRMLLPHGLAINELLTSHLYLLRTSRARYGYQPW